MLSLVMLAHAFLVFLPTVQGYQANAPIDAQNRAQIQAFLESGGDTLIQYKMKDDDYGMVVSLCQHVSSKLVQALL